MDAGVVMVLAVVLFALTAVLGATLAVRTVRGQDRPTGIVLAHGGFAAAGLVVLIVVALGDAPSLAGWALAVFAVAAAGGFFLFGLDRSRRALPVPAVLGHGLVAVVAFLLLLAAAAGVG
jgi:hypothetical protein